jgi:hypothetical protein
MDAQTALEIAKTTVGDRCTVTIHHGDHEDAIRITGCTHDEGTGIAHEISRAFHPGSSWDDRCVQKAVASQAGFVCVWF